MKVIKTIEAVVCRRPFPHQLMLQMYVYKKWESVVRLLQARFTFKFTNLARCVFS